MPDKTPSDQGPTLDQLLATTSADPTAVLPLLLWLAARDGSALVDEARREFTDAQILAAVTKEASDGRKRPPAKLTSVEGQHAIYLSSIGWTRVGSNRREQHPRAETLMHANGPNALRDWIQTNQHTWTTSPGDLTPRDFVPTYRARVATDPGALSEFTEEVSSRAWTLIKADSQDEAMGMLTTQSGKGGYKPDALIIEMVSGELAAELYAHNPATGVPLPDRPKFAPGVSEVVTAVEIEQSRKTYERIGAKVKKAQAAIDIHAVTAVLWVVSTADVWRDLTDLGVGHSAHYPMQRLVPAAWIGHGLEGDPIKNPDPFRIWAHFAYAARYNQAPAPRRA